MIYKKNKKAVSAMIGYVLLVAFAVVMGGIIFNWMKSYVPKDPLQCPEGISVFIKDINCQGESFNLTLKNNGRFNIAGYFIHGTNSTDTDQVATIDLSKNLVGGVKLGSAVLYAEGMNNNMKPGVDKNNYFNLSENITAIELIPIRFEVVENRKRMITCTNAKVVEEVDCSVAPIPLPPPSYQYTEIGYFGFEVDEGGWFVSGIDSDRNNLMSNVSDDGTSGGSWSLHIQDDTASSTIYQSFNLENYDSVEISWKGYYENLGPDDCINLTVGGILVDTWGGNNCANTITLDQWILQSITAQNNTYNFNDSMEIRFTGGMNNPGNRFYIDGINITGRELV